MATQETQQIDAIIDSSRRKMIALGGTALAGLALVGMQKANAATITDGDVLNFALNLEYLEANFYSLAVNGKTIDQLSTPVSITGTGTQGVVTTKPSFAPVPFTGSVQDTLIKAYAMSTAKDEINHVVLLSSALGSYAVAQPALNLYTSFYALATAAGIPNGSSFDPFASSTNFLLGAYIFEDVGVSAYHGAAASITSKQVLGTAVGIHAVEAYHAGLIRTTLASIDAANGNTTLSGYTQMISSVRAQLTQTQPSTAPAVTAGDVGLTTASVSLEGGGSYTAATIVNADSNSLGWARTPAQVLAIVTDGNNTGANTTTGAANTGLFFTAGMNGVIN